MQEVDTCKCKIQVQRISNTAIKVIKKIPDIVTKTFKPSSTSIC